MQGKLIKLKSLQSLTEQERIFVKEGDIIEGNFNDWPKIGQSFTIFKSPGKNLFSFPVFTTEVQEIIDDRTFRTRNSIYKIITIEDERENKISIIIE